MLITALCKKHNITGQTFFRRRNRYGGMDMPDARRLKGIEAENAKLKRLVSDPSERTLRVGSGPSRSTASSMLHSARGAITEGPSK